MTTGNLAIQDNSTVVQYTSVGESSFVFPFPVLENDELKVSRNQVQLTFGVDYSITGLGDDGGGFITLLAGASTPGDIWTLWQDMPIERLTGFSAGAATILGAALNAEFAARLRVEQQLRREIRNCLHVPVDDPVGGQNLQIPSRATRTGKFAVYDANGNPAVASGTGNDSALRADLANGLAGPGSTLIAHKRTAAEIAAAVIPTNYTFASHEVCGYVLPERYGAVGNGNAADVVNGALDTGAIAKAITMSAATKCPILLSRTYIAVPVTASTQEGPAAITVAWLIQTNMNVRAIGGAGIKLADNQSTDATPKNLGLFFSNAVTSDWSFKDVVFDLNGANNKISPARPAVYDNTKNMAAIAVSGTPGGIAARANDVRIQGCTFKNCPGVCALVTGQSNSVGITLGQRWWILENLFLNNGTDAQDHTSIFAWCDVVTCRGNIFWEDQPPHTVGKTGGATCYEVHGANHRLTGNYFFNYTLGMYVGSNFTSPVIGTVVANNDFYCSDYGILLFRQQTPASSTVDGVLIEGNSFYFDNWTYAGQPNTRAAVRFQGQLGVPQQLAVNNIKITGNYAIAAGTGLYSNFVRWDTVTIIGAQVCSNLSITDNQVIGFTEGVYILTNAANGMGKATVSRNEFINLTPDGLGNPPMGIHVNANGGFTTLIIDGNEFTDERGAPSFARGIYLDTGTITSLYLGRQIYKGLTVANYAENGGLVVTNWLGPAREGVAVIPYSANMTPDWSAGTCHTITVTDAVAHTLNLPTRMKDGDVFQLTIRNTTGGAIGAITFNANYGKSAWTQPATLQNRSIAFRKNGAIYTQIHQTGVDVPN